MSIKTRLAARQESVVGRSTGGIAANGQLFSHKVSIGESQAKKCEKLSEIIAHVVDVLLGIDEFTESSDAITCKELVLD